MMRSLFSAVSGLRNQQTAMDVIGNNISNVNTIAYKTKSVVFNDIFSQTISEASGASANSGGTNAKQVGLGMSISSIRVSATEGSTQSTGNPLDFAISGQGFFVVQGADGNTYYTRNGATALDDEGNLVYTTGEHIMGVMIADADIGTASLTDYTATSPALEPIVIDPDTYTDYSIDSNGVITAIVADNTALAAAGSTAQVGDQVELGRVVLATFVNDAGLTSEGSNLYSVSANSGEAVYGYVNEDACGSVNSGTLEMSNVDLANELTSMILMQRGFQASSRVITTSDTMLEELVNLKRS